MKIVVLAGGLSPERNVSLSSGAMVCQALRDRGHQAAFVDMFFGTERYGGAAEELFTAPLPDEIRKVSRQAPDLAAVRASRRSGGTRSSRWGGMSTVSVGAAGALAKPPVASGRQSP